MLMCQDNICNKSLACYVVEVTEKFLTSQHDRYSFMSHRQSLKLVEIKVIEFCSCRLQYNQKNQTCDHNQDNIEICSVQQVRAGRELLYTETDFSECMHWWALTDSCSHASSHVDNTAL